MTRLMVGDGYDFAAYYNLFDPSVVTGLISVDLAAGTVTGDASVGTDTLRSVEIIRGTQFDDIYTAVGFGLAGALNVSNTGTFNQFEGMGGDDTITGNGNTRIDYNFALAAGDRRPSAQAICTISPELPAAPMQTMPALAPTRL